MSNAGIDYRTIGYSPSEAEKELSADEVYERGRSFLDRPEITASAASFQMREPPKPFALPLQRVLHRQIGAAMVAMKAAAEEKHSLILKANAQQRAFDTAREELGAVLDAWPAEKVVPA